MGYPYVNKGPVESSVGSDTGKMKNKSVVITGAGSSGLGAAYVKAFLNAGAFVTNADINPSNEHQENPNYQFYKCDVTVWKDQVEVFKGAIANSPENSLDVVIANAGIGGHDSIFQLEDGDEPSEPQLRTVKVNYIGVIYTAKLAMHYFNKQDPSRDRCLILKGSLASYLDLPGGPEYQSSKFGVRGLMCCLRTSGRMRINLLAPWWARTGIMPDEFARHIDDMLRRIGSQWIDLDDAGRCALRIATDESIHGRGFVICSREMDPNGYADMNADDYDHRDDAKWLKHIMQISKRGMEPVDTSAN
ncbi:uncharacterized protein PV09_09434 [Verruconis gallopava]|uniref:Uncharacterized protein n=1 Tax=Verruconis gallopava TaxID=253628 RepID=A0A0D1YDK5_9PEZI|nr:uncharacterized protein PV09_09434 [Verruconis gallopava]KIV98821.1 hypothetical protein PV09_09434 [Verruconis gallopava]